MGCFVFKCILGYTDKRLNNKRLKKGSAMICYSTLSRFCKTKNGFNQSDSHACKNMMNGENLISTFLQLSGKKKSKGHASN